MAETDFAFWVMLPPATEGLSLLRQSADLADPLLDLRYGDGAYRRKIASEAVKAGLSAITVIADLSDGDVLAFLKDALPAGSRVVLCAEDVSVHRSAQVVCALRAAGKVVGFEVGGQQAAQTAFEAGAEFLLASGNEAAGPVSAKTALILVQELLDCSPLPLVVRGSLGPLGAAAVYAAGCAGCVLDSQVLLLPESPISPRWREMLSGCSPGDTGVVGALLGRPFRVLASAQAREYERLRAWQGKAFSGEEPREGASDAIRPITEGLLAKGFRDDAALPPVGQGIAFAQQFQAEGIGIRDVLRRYRGTLGECVERLKGDFPFRRGSPVARFHGVDLPIVQGPMGIVTGNSRLAREVSRHGALPFVAAGGASAEQARQLIADTRDALQGKPFGVGVICLGDMGAESTAAVLDEKPDFITVAGASADVAREIADAGVTAYLHAPSLAHVQDLLDAGATGLILEGHEAGGHVSRLGSLILWELAAQELTSRDRRSVADVRVLFAGGLGTATGSFMASVFASALAEHGVASGPQLGTAYLLTEEAVASGALSAPYRQALLVGSDTITSGDSVNLPTRWALTPASRALIAQELKWQTAGRPLGQRKQELEKLTWAHLHAAVTGGRVASAEGESQTGPAYMCGQVICALASSRTIAELHEALIEGAADLAKRCPALAQTEDDLSDAIAVIGMGCMFPQADNVEQYWQNLLGAVSAIREVPPDRWDSKLYYDPSPEARDKSSSKLGAFIEGFEKDPVKFHIPPVAADCIDRIQFLALEVAHQTLEDAGYLGRAFDKERAAVVLGNSMGGEMTVSYALRLLSPSITVALESIPRFRDLPDDARESIVAELAEALKKSAPALTEDSCAGNLGSIIAGRVCNQFDFGAASFTLDGACASSLAALEVGIRGLRSGQFDLVLAGGADTRMDPPSYVMFSNLGVLSDTGCRPFDENADGFVMGEGVGMVLLKRWGDAVRDADKVYALIRSVGSSSDGAARSITAPDVEGQVLGMQRAYEGMSFAPADVSLVEAHGTATWNGDLTELTSLSRMFRVGPHGKHSVALGSVKSMIGHLKTAAGIAGLIKVILALHHKVLPPAVKCERPRKDVDWQNSPFYLISEPRPWESPVRPRRAAVNSFGFGGVNYHVVVEEAPTAPQSVQVHDPNDSVRFSLPAELLIFRAATRPAVFELVSEVEGRLAAGDRSEMHRAALALQEPGRPGGATLAVVARDVDSVRSHCQEARRVLADEKRREWTSAKGIYYGESLSGKRPKVAFLFPGQGSQYVNMGGDLLSAFPFLRNTFDIVDRIAQRWTGSSVLPTVFVEADCSEGEKKARRARLERTDCNHPALLAMWAGLVSFLRRAAIHPDMVAGHSVGEYGALYAAGVFDLESVVAVTTARGSTVYEHAFQHGTMAAIGAPAEEVEAALADVGGVANIANKNCPAQTVISGDVETVRSVVERFEALGVRCALIPVASGFHSPLMASCVEPFREFIEAAPLSAPTIPVQCNVTGAPYEAEGDFGSKMRDALAQHLVRPVEFVRNVESMYAAGARLFLEVGPGSTLCAFVDNILGARPHWAFPTNLPRTACSTQLLHVLAFCAVRGLDVNARAVLDAQGRRLPGRAVRPSLAPRPSAATPEPRATAPDLAREALADASPEAVADYVRQRHAFIKDMVRLDFEHFTGGRSAAAPHQEVAADDSLASKVVNVVCRKTGYPREVIDLDLDVEAELGLDSIKQAEILRELEQELHVDLRRAERGARRRISTLREVIASFSELLSGRPADRGASAPPDEQAAPDAPLPANLECHRFVCTLRAAPLCESGRAERLAGRTVLLLADAQGVGAALTDRLRDAGAAVSVLPWSGDWHDPTGSFDLVLDLWSYGEDDWPGRAACTEWWSSVESRAVALLNVATQCVRLARERKDGRSLWVEVTSLGGELGARRLAAIPSRAGVGLGVSRCLFADHPELVDPLYLDFDPAWEPAQVADRIIEELCRERSHNEVGYRDGRRFEIHWTAESKEPQADPPPLTPGSVVLAVGGARGIAASLCLGLAGSTEADFILVGRSRFDETGADTSGPRVELESARKQLLAEFQAGHRRVVPAELDRLAWERVWSDERARNVGALRRLARSVAYRQCDLTDAQAVRELVDDVLSQHGRIDLVINGAGSLAERTIEEFDSETFIAGLRQKALGTANLLEALPDGAAGAFVNLSSVVGRWGHSGLASYAVGHATASILVAGMRGRRKGRWLDLLYGPWLNVGMTRIGSTIERVARSEGTFVSEAAGRDYFQAELSSGSDETTALRGRQPFGVLREPARNAERHPLLDAVWVVKPGLAEGSAVLDPKRNRLVAEHRVALEPILPGAVAIEMMAQTASVLVAPELLLTDVEDVEFVRPVRFPGEEPREFRTRAAVLASEEDGAWLSAELFSIFRAPDGTEPEERQHARCKARFGRREAPAKPSLLVVQTGLGSCSVDMRHFWETEGASTRLGIFRNVQVVSSATPDSVAAQIIVPGADPICRQPCTGNPVRLDGFLYASALPDSLFSGHPEHYVQGVKAVRFFASTEGDEARFCRSVITERSSRFVIADIEGLDSMGRVLERIHGSESVRTLRSPLGLSQDATLRALRWNPQRTQIAELLGLGGPLALAEARVAHVEAALEAQGETAFLNSWLCAEEQAMLAGMRHQKRRREWLAGRIAAKEAVCSLVGANSPPPNAVRVLSLPTGNPHVEGVPAGVEEPLCVSISHSEDSACAGAVRGQRLGVDVERGTLDVDTIAERFCTPSELEVVCRATSQVRVPALMTTWVAKESALKALSPQASAMTDLRLDGVRETDNYLVCELSSAAGCSVRAVTFRSYQYFYGVAAVVEASVADGVDGG
jgi:acyl transferase domain-containing protein/NAD(P)H-dependent flavin oxidoreductase YrpB (nitropropane dioxygenase family)/NAD(P)-dependent dehydrogenase (short-subunit alcohol dehydrogenase family)/phosphopantetheinyl transferase